MMTAEITQHIIPVILKIRLTVFKSTVEQLENWDPEYTYISADLDRSFRCSERNCHNRARRVNFIMRAFRV